ncbi:ATP-binding cassette sub-family B member 5 [Lemmus lemmus]
MRLRHLAFKAMLHQASTSRLDIITQDVSSMVLSALISFIHGWEMTLLILTFAPVLAVTGMVETTAVAGFASKDKQELKRAGKVKGRLRLPALVAFS